MAQSLAKNLVHLIFSTKNRQPLISEEVQSCLHRYMTGIFRDLGSPVLCVNSVPDHIHILFNLNKNRALADVIMEIKRGTSKWIKTQGPLLRRFNWQSGYGAFSVSQSAVAQVTRYIVEQPKHHRKKTFQEEFCAFLRRYDIEFDDRYIWD